MLLFLLACPTPDEPEPVEPETHDLVDGTWTTLQSRWGPLVPPQATLDAMEDGTLSLYDWQAFEDWSLGVAEEAGDTWRELADLAPDFVEGTERRSVAWIWQAADPQVIDEESPIRLSAFEELYRPQGHLSPHAWEAHVRTAARLEEVTRPYDFALIAGDLTDGGQENELDMVLTALLGGVVDPDSGDDDQTRFNIPFHAIGLTVPWYAAVGNHDVLYIGGFDAVTDELRDAAVDDDIYYFGIFPNGFRDGSSEGAELLTEGPTPADPHRTPLRLAEYLQTLEDHGHVPTQTGYYAEHPMADVPLLLVVLNTVNDEPEGVGVGAQGHVDEAQLAWLTETLDRATTDGDLVLVMSHHRAKDLGSLSPVSEEQLVEALTRDAVILHVTGHGHTNTDHLHPGDAGYYELMLASTLDFPIQSRILELVDEGNGFLSVYTTNLDHLSPEGSPAHDARSIAAGKYAFPLFGDDSDVAGDWASDVDSQNLLIRMGLTDAQQQALAVATLPEEVLSTDVLAGLSR